MDKKLLFLIILFFFVFSAFSFTALRQGSFSSFIRAKEGTVPSAEKSLILAWPVTVNLTTSNQSKITVFIRNNKEVPIANKSVQLNTSFGSVTPSIATTDKTGKAEFFLQSNSPGLAEITALVDNNIELKQKITIKFE
jgi:hypothetical protein